MKQPQELQPRKAGRPSEYNEEIALKICQLLTSGLSLTKISRLPGMPRAWVMCKWMAQNPVFEANLSRARQYYAELMSTEIIELADKVRMGKKIRRSKDGVETTYGDMVDRARLQVETRKWYLSKVLPKIYGDRVDVQVSGEVDLVAVLRRRIAQPPVIGGRHREPGVDDETANTKQIEGERLPESDS